VEFSDFRFLTYKVINANITINICIVYFCFFIKHTKIFILTLEN